MHACHVIVTVCIQEVEDEDEGFEVDMDEDEFEVY